MIYTLCDESTFCLIQARHACDKAPLAYDKDTLRAVKAAARMDHSYDRCCQQISLIVHFLSENPLSKATASLLQNDSIRSAGLVQFMFMLCKLLMAQS
ncbi:hypothetical protein D3C86_695610 [compost metagenome]